MDTAERDALLTLVLTPGLGHTLIGRCLQAFGGAAATLDASVAQLTALRGLTAKTAHALRATREGGAAARELELTKRHGAHLVTMDDPAYPRLLSHIPDPPRLLWVRGELRPEDALALAIVGSRRCTHYGREQAHRFGRDAAQAGLCVVSGGAYGIDAAAHAAALEAGGRTIAVLGSGLARPYPQKNAALFTRISTPPAPAPAAVDGAPPAPAAPGGAVISELPMGTPPIGENFPRRNRIISGLALGVVLIEAAKRSGALITARLCVEDHGRELLAVPGRVDSPSSVGCHKVLREGWATLATGIADVLDALGEAGQILKAQPPAASPGRAGDAPAPDIHHSEKLSVAQRQIVDHLEEPRALDELAAATGLPVHKVQAELTLLEVRGTIQRAQGLFTRRR